MLERTNYSDSDDSQAIVVRDIDRDTVKNEIHKLFVFHDKHITKERLGILADELCNSGSQVKHILSGLRDLQGNEQIEEIKIWRLKRAVRARELEGVTGVRSECSSCRGHGLVSAVRMDGPHAGCTAAFACICDNGAKVTDLAKWAGYESFTHAGTNWKVWPDETTKPMAVLP